MLFNLGELQQAVLQLADAAAAGFGRELSAALDPRKLSASSVAAGGAHAGAALPGSAGRVQDLLWQKLGAALDHLQRRCEQETAAWVG